MCQAVGAALAALAATGGFAAQPAGLVAHSSLGWKNATIDSARTNAQQLTIQQSQPKAILNWSQFNIKPGERVHFEQQSASWAALNRIHQTDPSRIQGSVTARGQVYLINQNGIVFASGAQVNVGSLVASTVDIADSLFDAGILSNRQAGQVPAFTSAELPSGTVVVENGATLETAREGRIMLIGRDVSNNGVISTPDGQAVLAAGAKVYLAASSDPSLRGLLVEVDNGGTVTNLPLGRVVAERGNVTMVGLAVNQSGRVTATTSVNLNGSIRLLARDTVVAKEPEAGVQVPQGSRGGEVRLGVGSVTEVTPEYGSSETSKDNQTFNRSKVEVAGRSIRMDADSAIVARSGTVSLSAQRGLDFQGAGAGPDPDARIYLDKRSRIDVSGTQDVVLPMSRNVIDVELRGTELADAPLQRDGILRGKTVQVDIRKGTPLANIAGNVAQISRAIDERTTTGGTVSLQSEGDIVLRSESAINVSGGSVRFLDGPVKTTKLLTADGAIVDIGAASPDKLYTNVIKDFTVDYKKWGVSEVFALPARTEAGYVDGANAGSITLIAHAAVLDGELIGRSTIGRLQRDSGRSPLGGTLTIGDAAQANVSAPSFKIPDVKFVFATTPLPANFTFAVSEAPGSPITPLPEPARTSLHVPTAMLRGGGFSRLAIYSDGAIRIGDDQRIELEAGGSSGSGASLTLFGRSIEHDGSILVSGGAVNLRTVQPLSASSPLASDYDLVLGSKSSISTAGRWTNDHPSVAQAVIGAVMVDAGSIVLRSESNLVLKPGSVLDVSAGGWRQVDGKLKFGDAGSITLRSGRFNRGPFDPQLSTIELNAELRGYGFDTGGTLTLDTSRVQIGSASPIAGVLSLDSNFFRRGGFSTFSVNGQDGLTVADETRIEIQNEVRQLSSRFAAASNGTSLSDFSSIAFLPQTERVPGALMLSANSTSFGDVTIGEAARLDPGIGGTIDIVAGNRITVMGELVAPGGEITLTTAKPELRDFGGAQSIWLGSTARIDARGIANVLVDDRGLRSGDVMNGGAVTVAARTGYVIAERGAVIDVSATQAEIDIVTVEGQARTPTRVYSDAGSVVITAQEGILLDATLKGTAASEFIGSGGTLVLGLDAAVAGASFPTAPRRIMVGESARVVPESLQPGQIVDPLAVSQPGASQFSHRVMYSTGAFDAGGFDRITLRSPDRIEFHGVSKLVSRQAIMLEALALNAAPGATASVATNYLSIGNPTAFMPPLPENGDGSFTAAANLIDIEGKISLGGWARTTMRSSGDVRLKGTFFETGAVELSGQLTTTGSVQLDAARVYPTSATNFLIESIGSDSRIGIGRTGPAALDTVFSAAGTIALAAADIEQAGVLRAPFGAIMLDASRSLTLAPGSMTSVSGEGQSLPYGRTELSARNYVYGLGPSTNIRLTRTPEKRIELRSPTVTMAEGATIDVAGGGDMFAYEFVPGPGGSRDVLSTLSAPTTFAILPGLDTWYAPYDHQEYRSGVAPALRVGDAVQFVDSAVFARTDSSLFSGMMDASRSLAAGFYTLLPARYGLLPGAFLVDVVPHSSDRPSGSAAVQIDGSRVLSGHLATSASNGWVRSGRSVGVKVRPAESARVLSEYIQTSVSDLLSPPGSGLAPADAGVVSIAASAALVFGADVRTAHPAHGAGARIDIAAPKLLIAGATASGFASDFLRLDPARLESLGADSLLLGATRRTEPDGTRLQVTASEVIVANGGAAPLSAPEILVAATDSIRIEDNARVSGVGGARLSTTTYLIGDDATDGNGAFLRVASGPQAGVVRNNADGTTGTLTIGSGAVVAADGAALLDASRDSVLGGQLSIASQGALALSSGRIGLGEAARVSQGLVLGSSQLDALSGLGELALQSYSTLDFYGGVTLGSGALGRLRLDAAGMNGYLGTVAGTASDVAIVAKEIIVSNNRGVLPGSATLLSDGTSAVPGVGALQLTAAVIEVGSDKAGVNRSEFGIKQFERTTLHAPSQLLGRGRGGIVVEGDFDMRAGRFTVAAGAEQSWTATGRLTVGSLPPVDPVPKNESLGGKLALTGRSVEVGGSIDLPSGVIAVTALGGQPGDGVTLTAGATLSVRGSTVEFDGVAVAAPGGEVTLTSVAGDVRIEPNATVDVGGAIDGQAGRLAVTAPAGTFELEGRLIGRASATGGSSDPTNQGHFALEVGSLADFSLLNSALNTRFDSAGNLVAGGFDASRTLRVRSGDVVIAAGDTVRAHELALSVDDGNLRVDGRVDATGAKGGRIELYAREQTLGNGNITVGGILDARALAAPIGLGGTAGRGGSIVIGAASDAPGTNRGGASDARIALTETSRLDVGGAGDGAGGQVTLRAPRLGVGAGNGVGVSAMSGDIDGASSVVIEAYKVYAATSVTGAGATVDGGNFNVSTTGAAANTLAFREAGTFISTSGASILTTLGQIDNPVVHVRPGVEIRSPGDLTVNINETAAQHLRGWNLATWRFGNEPGVLTLRAAGDIKLNSSIGDGFNVLNAQPMQNWTAVRDDASWSYRLSAGADLSAADPLQVRAGVGDILLAAGKLLRTGAGGIEVSAGRDLTLAASTSVIYTSGRNGPAIPDYVSPVYRNESNQALRASYPVDGGDIRIAVGRDVSGVAGSQFISDWLMQRAAQRGTDGVVRVLNPQTNWWPRVQTFEQGVATLAGGDIVVDAGRDIRNVSFAAPTNGVLAGPADQAPDLANLVLRGGGDLSIRAARDVLGGVYLGMAGDVDISAGGSIANGTRAGANNAVLSLAPVLALGDAVATVSSTGALSLGAVVDPTLVPQRPRGPGTPLGGRDLNAFASYSNASGVTAVSLGADVTLINDDNTLALSAPQIFGSNTSQPVLSLYPGTLRAAALRGDVIVDDAFTMFPSARGNLELLADGSIRSSGTIKMSDLSPASLPSLVAPTTGFNSTVLIGQGRYDAGVAVHSTPPLHVQDDAPVRIVATDANIQFVGGVQVILPKKLRMIAGGDIVNPDLGWQHVRSGDVSLLSAGRDIVSTSPIGASGVPGSNDRTILLGGPGELQVIAGRNIDLGTSSGIVTRGALDNPALPENGANISVLAGATSRADYEGFLARYVDTGASAPIGYGTELVDFVRARTDDPDVTAAQALEAFRAMPFEQRASFAQQVLVAELKAAGREAVSNGVTDASSYACGFLAIERLFPGSDAKPTAGDINLFFSQIKTEQGGDIRLLAPTGLINAGLANQGRFSKEARDLGIVTIAGGSIEALAREDFLVNQSRVFTLGGGNITLWSSNGNIDAGRGSKTAAATPPPQFKIDGNGVFSLDISQSIAGSGIGVLLARPGVTAGDVDLIAPRGEVNAGDAGIRAAGNLSVAALRVVDNGNISVGGRSTGVPTTDTGSIGAGLAVAGTGVVEAARSSDMATRAIADGAQSSQQVKDAFRPSFLTVEVLGFGD